MKKTASGCMLTKIRTNSPSQPCALPRVWSVLGPVYWVWVPLWPRSQSKLSPCVGFVHTPKPCSKSLLAETETTTRARTQSTVTPIYKVWWALGLKLQCFMCHNSLFVYCFTQVCEHTHKLHSHIQPYTQTPHNSAHTVFSVMISSIWNSTPTETD